MKRNNRAVAKQLGWEGDNLDSEDMQEFPVERARARFAWIFVIMQCVWIICYGWTIHYKLV
jgi:hypothetical protein